MYANVAYGISLFFTLTAKLSTALTYSASFSIVGACAAAGIYPESGRGQFGVYIALSALMLVALIRAKYPKWSNLTAPAKALISLYLLTFSTTLFFPQPNWFYLGPALFVVLFTFMATALQRITSITVTRVVWVTSLVESLIAIGEFTRNQLFFSPLPIGQSDHAFLSGATRASATLGHPLVLSMLLITGIILLLKETKINWIVRGSAIAVLFGGIYAAGSASVVFALGAAILADLIARKRASLVLSCTLILVWLLLYFQYFSLQNFSLTSEVTGLAAQHRLDSILSLPNLLTERTLFQAFFGSGWGSIDQIFTDGIIPDSPSHAIDNQFVSSLALSGLFGLVLTISFIWTAFLKTLKSQEMHFPLLIASITMFWSFDLFSWSVTGGLLAIVSASSPNGQGFESKSVQHASARGAL
jgi:hypothetical protein